MIHDTGSAILYGKLILFSSLFGIITSKDKSTRIDTGSLRHGATSGNIEGRKLDKKDSGHNTIRCHSSRNIGGLAPRDHGFGFGRDKKRRPLDLRIRRRRIGIPQKAPGRYPQLVLTFEPATFDPEHAGSAPCSPTGIPPAGPAIKWAASI